MEDEDKSGIDGLLRRFKVVMNDKYEDNDFDFPYFYDVVVVFDGKPVLRTTWGCGGGWKSSDIGGGAVLESVLSDAMSYEPYDGTPDEDALPDFLEDLGFLDDAKSIKQGMRAFWECKRLYEALDGIHAGGEWLGEARDRLEELSSKEQNGLVGTDLDTYVDDLMERSK